jgi:hypothetical protein
MGTHTRRDLLSGLGAAALVSAAPRRLFASGATSFHAVKADEAFLAEMIRLGCDFFWEHGHPQTGQVLDRARADGKTETRRMASIAATGFGLSALCVADRYGFYPHEQILERVRNTMRFHWKTLPQKEGFFYHFSDWETGVTSRGSELSSIDTALLLCGVLSCRAYFHDAEIQDLATKIYERVNWPWMLDGGSTPSMGWFERTGFLKARWNMFAEEMMLYLLAIGSPTHPLAPSYWDNFSRPTVKFQGIEYLSADAPIFIHQYTQAWFDMRGKRDKYADYFENSKKATEAHRLFCISLGGNYSAEYWGITASDSEQGYTGWGGPPKQGDIDGTVVPAAAAGSLAFLPGECLQTLIAMRKKFGQRAWGRYGFVDAFNPAKPWYDGDVLGIDLGIGVLAAENLRSGMMWDTFMRNKEMVEAMRLVGFKKT